MDSTIFEEGAFNSAIVQNYRTTYFEKKPLILVGTYTKNSPFQTPSTIAAMAATCRCSGVLCPAQSITQAPASHSAAEAALALL